MKFTAREIELIDGMIDVHLDHARRCDTIAHRTMAEKQKGWDLERVALLEKIKNTRTDPLITAALSWWECKRPTLWSVEEHANNPTVNCINDREKALAVEVARFVAGGGEDGR